MVWYNVDFENTQLYLSSTITLMWTRCVVPSRPKIRRTLYLGFSSKKHYSINMGIHGVIKKIQY